MSRSEKVLQQNTIFEKVLPTQNSGILTILRKTRFNHVSSLKLPNHLDTFLLKVSGKRKREIRKVLELVLYTRFVLGPLLSRSTDYGRPMKCFFIKTLRVGQTIWADKFWGIWVIFGHFISTHFGTGPIKVNQKMAFFGSEIWKPEK